MTHDSRLTTKLHLHLPQRRITKHHPVMRRPAMFTERSYMRRSGIANVGVPAVVRPPRRQGVHQPVAGDLGHQRRRCDGVTMRITLHERLMILGEFGHSQTVDQDHRRGARRERCPAAQQGTSHREHPRSAGTEPGHDRAHAPAAFS